MKDSEVEDVLWRYRMINMKGRKDRPCLGTHMESENQRGRWEESSNLDKNSKALNFLVRFGFVFDILDYSSDMNSLVSSKVTGTQEVRL